MHSYNLRKTVFLTWGYPNSSGFTSVLSEGTVADEAVEAAVISPSQKRENSEAMYAVLKGMTMALQVWRSR